MKNRKGVLRYIGLFILLQTPIWCIAQKRGAVWCFGDSALVDFSDTSNITFGTSSLKTRGSCASICDTSGQLVFYTGYDTDTWVNGGPAFKNVEVFNRNHNTMVNGDSVIGQAWYREDVITDDPSISNQYYVFSIGVTAIIEAGFYYSIVDMNANGGLGEVIQKNVQLQNFKNVDCLSAVKHGNGRDWWVFSRRWDNSNNEWSIYLVNDNGINSPIIMNVGTIQSTGFGNISFNSSGTKMSYINTRGIIELYDFDRCTGIISNPVTISQENSSSPYPNYWSAEFSPSGRFLYITQIAPFSGDSCYLVQFDLTSVNIAQSADTIWQTSFMEDMGQLKLAPDGRIYLTTNYYGGYPYADTTYNYINTNLSVINSPDSLGMACNLQPFSFYLGGKRSYFGLPNNPDYDMPALAGSSCDTLVGISEPQISTVTPQLNIFYHPGWQTVFINASNLTGTKGTMEIYDVHGKRIHSEAISIMNGYYTRNFNMEGFGYGMYFVTLQSGQQRLSTKFIKRP